VQEKSLQIGQTGEREQMEHGVVSVEADLYVVLSLESEALWASLACELTEGVKSKFAFRERDIVLQEPIDLPDAMPDWYHCLVDIDPNDVVVRSTRRIIATEKLSLLPDTLDWSPLRLVSKRVRDFLITVFPDGSRFYPFLSKNASSNELEATDLFYWLPRHYLRFRPNPRRGSDQWMIPDVWGSLGGQDVTWEMFHNRAFQELAVELPFWTPSPSFGQIVFRRDVYKAIKESGFSGFCEAPAGNYLSHKPEHSVGYVHFKK
jgi:hypothetical protein